ncbi:unnamed protein product [Pleuronectes platessa]|uniref:Cryptochrome/DNA photolyase FAD-binding domain-containing protein n=1 Tax=Pleuronectes platessa TaxID=8262 RepID=A0A9N7VDP6_PLEPL|nr:unnamed protein product [Pleuronectes platessa]
MRLERPLERKVFEELLLDADWSVNAGSWMCFSCSSFFFQQVFRCYCPAFWQQYLPIHTMVQVAVTWGPVEVQEGPLKNSTVRRERLQLVCDWRRVKCHQQYRAVPL